MKQFFKSEQTSSQLHRRITRITKYLRMKNPWPPAKYSVGGHFYIPLKVGEKPDKIPLGFFGSTGCNWARMGGCTMCDYGGFEGSIPDITLIKQAKFLLCMWDKYTEINLSSLGSFFDDNEVSPTVRSSILKLVAKQNNLRVLGVESRADTITKNKIMNAKHLLGNKIELEVGIGFESLNSIVRNVCINKGLSINQFDKSIKLISEVGAQSVAHVLLKPPFLEESEAIHEAIRTIEFLSDMPIKRIVLMVTNVKKGTLVGKLYERGYYSPPFLWSVLETVLGLSNEAISKLVVYGFECGMPMEAIGSNCRKCNDTIRSNIDLFSQTNDIVYIKRSFDINCECKNIWKKLIHTKVRTDLKTRIDLQCSILEGEFHLN